MKLAVTILQLLCGLAIILIVLFQSGKSEGLSGAIGGVADSFLAKNKARTIDAKLAQVVRRGVSGAHYGAADHELILLKKERA